MALSKDSAEVVRFSALFSRLRDWSDDEPDALIELAAQDNSIKQLCIEVSNAAMPFELSERNSRELFVTPVDPAFIVKWRDYENRYASILAQIWLSDLVPTLTFEDRSSFVRSDRWGCVDESAQEASKVIESAISFAFEQASEEWREFAEDFREGIEDGAVAWERLKDSTAFDLRGIFRRCDLVPFVLIPRQVAARISDMQRFSLFKNLQQAYDAFIFGAPFAALALMRSILEAVLRDHYGAEGDDLRERIVSVRGQLPRGVQAETLDDLRRLANSILHLDSEGRLPEDGEIELEKRIIVQLFALRSLIEATPQGR